MVNINWEELGFGYMDLPYRYRAYYKDGKWTGGLEESSNITINEAATVFHYGQACFEGMKAYRTKDGDIQLFRPDQNATRMAESCRRLLMPVFDEDLFIEAVKETVKANADYVPPHGTGASLYLRPFMIGSGEKIGVGPSDEYIFSVFAMPVGPYFKGGLEPANFWISDLDRAAPAGTGAVKVGGNYAASLLPGKEAKSRHFADAIYLDPATHTKIEEIGSSNFFGIEKGTNKFITPTSPSILPSITKYSLLWLAENRLGIGASEEDVFVNDLDRFSEAGACGTAAVITPIGGIQNGDDFHVFHSETEVGPIVQKLYDELTGIQFGDIEAPEGWIVRVD